DSELDREDELPARRCLLRAELGEQHGRTVDLIDDLVHHVVVFQDAVDGAEYPALVVNDTARHLVSIPFVLPNKKPTHPSRGRRPTWQLGCHVRATARAGYSSRSSAVRSAQSSLSTPGGGSFLREAPGAELA